MSASSHGAAHRIVACAARHRIVLAAVYSLAFIALTMATGSRHDYPEYLTQWLAVWHGQDPWVGPQTLDNNTYGPLNLLFVPVAALHNLLPKLIFALAWLATMFTVVRRVSTGDEAPRVRFWLAALLLLNLFPWVDIAAFGMNDAVVVALLAFAVMCLMRRGDSALVGAMVGAAALLKFYPLLLLPFLAFDRGRIQRRTLLAGSAVFATGILASMTIWGLSVFHPVLFAGERGAKLLSFQAFLLDSPFSPLSGTGHDATVLKIGSVVFAIMGLTAFVAHWLWRMRALHGLMLAYAVIMTCYQVGHPQFYLTGVMFVPLYAAFLLERNGWNAETRRTIIAVGLPVAFVSVVGICYPFMEGFNRPPFVFVRQDIGALMFPINLAAVWWLFRDGYRQRAAHAAARHLPVPATPEAPL